MAVDIERRLRTRVPHPSLDRLDVRAGRNEQRRQVVMQVVSKSLNSSGRPRAAPGEANCHCHELNGSCGEGLFVTIPALADPEGDDVGENARVGGQKEFERCNRHGRDSSMIESECPAHNRQRLAFAACGVGRWGVPER